MPSISANLVEILIYVAPGFVVLYGLRRQSDTIQGLFNALQSEHGIGAFLALTLTAMAFGVFISGVSSLLVPWLSRKLNKDDNLTLSFADLDLARIYTCPAETLQVYQGHSRAYQSYANMAMALLISFVIFLYNLVSSLVFKQQTIDHWPFKLISFSVCVFFMLKAAVRYYGRFYKIAHSLSKRAA